MILEEIRLTSGAAIQIVQADLTDEQTDAIVNAANEQLQLGGGVAGAIRRKGGSSIQQECDKIGYTPTGSAAITHGGTLKARYVIHAVGPVWHGGNHGEEDLLTSAVRKSLELTEEKNLRSVSLPAISSGIFGFPKERCAEIILSTINDYLQKENRSLELVRCTNIDSETAHIFQEVFQRLFLEGSKW